MRKSKRRESSEVGYLREGSVTVRGLTGRGMALLIVKS